MKCSSKRNMKTERRRRGAAARGAKCKCGGHKVCAASDKPKAKGTPKTSLVNMLKVMADYNNSSESNKNNYNNGNITYNYRNGQRSGQIASAP